MGTGTFDVAIRTALHFSQTKVTRVTCLVTSILKPSETKTRSQNTGFKTNPEPFFQKPNNFWTKVESSIFIWLTYSLLP